MGSEHYCLRWNNHQSNLLGVFSQLLQDESLVDVTLACSEGASIRAHKVVLSACSSYFQTLFLDHPARHPIVILKDVRFAELRTLVDFMYKGEVNVEYCQLSALLKTAESLKVKGLAEMTNQNTALAEPKREPERLRPHSHSSAHASATATSLTSTSTPSSAPSGMLTTGTSAVSPHHHHHPSLGSPTSNAATAAAVAAAAASLGITDLSSAIGKSRGLDPDGRSPSPTRLDPPSPSTPLALSKHRDHTTHHSSVSSSATTTITTAAAERSSEERELGETNSKPLLSNSTNLKQNNISDSDRSTLNDSGSRRRKSKRPRMGDDDGGGGDEDDDDQANDDGNNVLAHEAGLINSEMTDHLLQHCRRLSEEQERRRSATANNNNNSDDDYEPAIKIKSEIEFSPLSGLNMTINSTSGGGLVNSSAGLLGTDLRPSSRDSGGRTPVACSSTTTSSLAMGAGGNGSGGLMAGLDQRSSPRSQRDRSERNTFGSGGIPSPLSEPIAGPSGMGPVQQVPLSLKKEIDWDRGDDKSSGDSSLDFRHPHDSEPSEPHAAGGNVSGLGGLCPSSSLGAGPPLGLGGGSVSAGAGGVGVSNLGAGGGSSSVGAGQDQMPGGSPGPIYPCMYCGATFQNQTKLTRHILSHSLETLKYRETAALHIHPSHLALLQQQHHELTAQAQHAAAAASLGVQSSSSSPSSLVTSPHFGPHRTGPPLDQLLEPPDGASQMELEFAAAVAAAASGNAVGAGAGDQGNVVLCKFCGKSFPDVSSLITHLPVHTGDRPFKCEFCGKAFKLRHHMKDHCRVHTGERPFRCGMCGKTFSRSTILKAHEKTHYPKYVRKFLSPSPIDGKDDSPQ
ncbi:protein tramtrack, beta isoform [Uranotaenia lowii]|uniref:protein tramtrack, beta isoform n=1 Tax=Uranotaenia lowii TaxID=190385 RepID=UPI0024797C9C|nr:protein tramtrack, beta isoform [Uranotaenia lowii]XP_055587352.1 protein tramtrack, beta isoform [Uranotaenia lowii]XP_055587353.1 protein tramtrack, beta isoform [Uranotaenia lowii]XP_055587354.1 protein tramtrack, beta isoform [Uranotaenia lowii]XP_055587355.1 protein tramtrack, beta isoform [Uranotaenia lowii]XP_055587356.1 protein tramtrack, beta isoform [Uranotaenia lowii]XP_055587357.1 protein tramtrack, beta isoform [Uranotaenia lowii]